MGKTADPPNGDRTAASANGLAEPGQPFYVTGDPNLSEEQKRKYRELLAYFQRQQDEWDRLTPQEQAEEEANWQAFKKSMNDERVRAGARPVFSDDD